MPGGADKINKAYGNIWKTPPEYRVRAFSEFLLAIGSILPYPTKDLQPVDFIGSMNMQDNPYRYVVELYGFP